MADETEFADVQFVGLSHPKRSDTLIVAIADFDGVPKVGVGPTQQEAIVDLFKNALPGQTMQFSAGAAMQLAHLDQIKEEPRA